MSTEELQDVMVRLQKANHLMENLIDTAMADDQISPDEKSLLMSINSNLEIYAKQIITTISDGSVSDEEKHKLKEIENKIISDAKSIVSTDSQVKEEEKRLMEQLIEVISSLSKP